MKILSLYPLPGIAYAHDANACALSDDVLFAAEEERFLRSQHAIGHVPERAAMVALREVRWSPADLDRLVVTSLESCCRRADFRSRVQYFRDLLLVPDSVPVACVPHHLAHSALAVLTSPFDDCAFLTVDGGGDGATGHWGTFRGGRFRIEERFEHSPAYLYQFLTGLCGLPLFEEGKMMGLAAYGCIDERLLAWLRRHFRIKAGGASLETDLTFRWRGDIDTAHVDLDRFQRHRYLRWHLDCRPLEDVSWTDDIAPPDAARTGQAFFEELMAAMVRHVVARSGLTRIACAGGAFLNVAATGVLRRALPQVELFVPMAPHDAGLALGAALWTHHVHGGRRPAAPVTPRLGASCLSSDVERVLGEFALDYDRPADFEDVVARAIEEGRVVGWFDGRAEYGARALGGRSVLADPRRADVKARLNGLLKRRDWFMPFAPSVLEEQAGELFADAAPSPYMHTTFTVRAERRADLDAAIHVDGTCRAHTVSRVQDPRFHALISRFAARTGVPAVLNTSFNRHGRPMVATPRDAVVHLLEGCVDVLAIDGFIARSARPVNSVAVEDGHALLQGMRDRHAERRRLEKRHPAAQTLS